MTTFCDFYSHLTTPESVKAAGYDAVSVYISHSAAKTATRAEVDAFRAAGLPVSFNFEDSATNSLAGFGQGVTDARFARQQVADVGGPDGVIIFFSVDFECSAEQIGTVVEYFKGVHTIVGPYLAGDYGSIFVVDELYAALELPGWQTSSWSDGKLSPHAVLWQTYYGQEFDSDRLVRPAPIWGIEATTPADPPTAARAQAKAAAKVRLAATAAQPKASDDMVYLIEATGEAAKSGHLDHDGCRPGEVFIVDVASKVKRGIDSHEELVLYQRLVPADNQLLGKNGEPCARLAATPTA